MLQREVQEYKQKYQTSEMERDDLVLQMKGLDSVRTELNDERSECVRLKGLLQKYTQIIEMCNENGENVDALTLLERIVRENRVNHCSKMKRWDTQEATKTAPLWSEMIDGKERRMLYGTQGPVFTNGIVSGTVSVTASQALPAPRTHSSLSYPGEIVPQDRRGNGQPPPGFEFQQSLSSIDEPSDPALIGHAIIPSGSGYPPPISFTTDGNKYSFGDNPSAMLKSAAAKEVMVPGVLINPNPGTQPNENSAPSTGFRDLEHTLHVD
jgi:hypothetical protein